MSIDPKLKMNRTGMGKYLLRQAFAKDDLLPSSILWREKAAFSDAVGHSMVDDLKAHAENLYSDEDLSAAKLKYPHVTPHTKEALWYRDLFESFYPSQSHVIPSFWMPNPDWVGSSITDPSARFLSNYNKSGE
jgi:asparagine synthase (glutamine-hydrolysing)